MQIVYARQHSPIFSDLPVGMSHEVAVCVPVRDERVSLPALVEALRGQGEFILCLFLDGCTDGSEAVARAAAGGLPLRTASGPVRSEPNAGRARRSAMALGLEAVGDRGVLLSTDADSVPAEDWIAAVVASLADCDVVAGRVERERAEADPMAGRIEAYYDRLYAHRRTLDPVAWERGPGHHYAAGANLGFRAGAYRALGGFPPLAAGEDATLVDDAMRAGFCVRRDPAPVVRTSARREGRVEGGLASALRRLDQAGEAGLTVGDPAAAVWQYERHAAARVVFPLLPERTAAVRLGATIGLSADHVLGVARDCPNAEAFAMRIVPAAPGASAPVPLAEAERTLAALEQALLEVAA